MALYRAESIKLGEGLELDARAYELRRSGRVLKLERIPMDLLLLLVEQRGQLVSREQIIERIWGKDVFLDADNSINAAIRKIRQVLRDDSERPRFIQTITGKGYRFIAAIVESGAPPTHPDAVSPETLIGKKVSHYRVLQVLGGGGMGVVYKAEDLELGRGVAIKFLPGELASDPAAFARVQKEARAASSLDHPNICSIYELGEHQGRPFIVMQLLQGQTLREWIAQAADRDSSACLNQVLNLSVQICAGMEAAHEKGIIHRDIKPANVFVTSRGEAKILDFGVAKFMADAAVADEGAATGQGQNQNVLETGASIGTPAYLSPEQVRCEKLDPRTDLFSFGLVLYEMATGRQAFIGDTAAVIREAVLHQPVVPPRQVESGIPAELECIILKALAKDRDQRYQSSAQLLTDLEDLATALKQPPALAGAQSQAQKVRHRNRPKILVAACLLLVALIAGGLIYRAHMANRLTEKDTVVIADFANSTGDPIFDDTLKQGLSAALHQSPFLTIISDDKVSANLKLMTRPANAPLTPEVAREVCERAGSKVYIAGAIAALGNEYVLGLKAVNCQTGDVLARQQVTVPAKERVVAGLGEAAAKLRSELGESLATVQKYDVPLEQATTRSLEALKAYTLAYAEANRGSYRAAIQFYERAIALDPDFAVAYAHMGQAYANSGQSSPAVESIKKAFERRARASELEKLYIETRYHELVTAQVDKRIEALELWEKMYPRDPIPHNDLASEYSDMGKYDQALAEAQQALLLAPQHVTVHILLGVSYMGLDKIAEARAVREKQVALNLADTWDHVDLYGLAYLQNDSAAMQRETDWCKGKSD
ncbi:MAG TPA: protein kinase, partial [Candidatus Angelobacter sp.]